MGSWLSVDCRELHLKSCEILTKIAEPHLHGDALTGRRQKLSKLLGADFETLGPLHAADTAAILLGACLFDQGFAETLRNG